jgi:hypothetical protein
MPVRAKAGRYITELFAGGQWFSHGECQTMPHADYEAAREAGDALFEAVVENIDWNRVLIEATSRHLSLVVKDCHPPVRGWNPNGSDLEVEKPCAECIREALLAEDRTMDWVVAGVPTVSPRRRNAAGDYAAVLARAITGRRTSTDDDRLERIRTDDDAYRVFDPRTVGGGAVTYDPVIGGHGTITVDGALANRPFNQDTRELMAIRCWQAMKRNGENGLFDVIERLYRQLEKAPGRTEGARQ